MRRVWRTPVGIGAGRRFCGECRPVDGRQRAASVRLLATYAGARAERSERPYRADGRPLRGKERRRASAEGFASREPVHGRARRDNGLDKQSGDGAGADGAQGESASLREAKRTAEQLLDRLRRRPREGAREAHSLTRALARCGNIEGFGEAMVLLSNVDGGAHVNADTYAQFMRACVRGGAPAEVLTVYRDFQSGNVPGSVQLYGYVLEVFGNMGDMEAVQSVLSDMAKAGVRRDTRTFNRLIHAASTNGALADAVRMYEVMRSQDVQPDGETLRLLVQSHLDADDAAAAQRALVELHGVHRVAVGAEVYTAFAKFYCRRGELDRVDAVLQKMSENSVEPPPTMYNTIMSTHVRLGNFGKAMDVFYTMSAKGLRPRAADFNVLLRMCTQLRDRRLIGRLLNSMREADVALGSVTYSTLLSMYARQRKWRAAEKLFDHACSRKQADTALYNHYLRTLMEPALQRDAVRRAVGLLRRMEREGIPPNVVTFTTLIHGCGEHADADTAVGLLQHMERSGIEANEVTYNAIMTALVRSGQQRRALAYYHRMRRRGVQPGLMGYTTAITAMCQLGDVDDAYVLLGEMRQRGIEPDVRLYHRLMVLEAGRENILEMLKLREAMARAGVELDLCAYKTLLNALMRRDDLGEVERTMAEMSANDVAVPETVLCALVKAYAWRGDLPMVLQTMKTLAARKVPLNRSVRETLDVIEFEAKKEENLAMRQQIHAQAELMLEFGAARGRIAGAERQASAA